MPDIFETNARKAAKRAYRLPPAIRAQMGPPLGRCGVCGRELDPWPLVKRSCSPDHWAKCASTDPSRAV